MNIFFRYLNTTHYRISCCNTNSLCGRTDILTSYSFCRMILV